MDIYLELMKIIYNDRKNNGKSKPEGFGSFGAIFVEIWWHLSGQIILIIFQLSEQIVTKNMNVTQWIFVQI